MPTDPKLVEPQALLPLAADLRSGKLALSTYVNQTLVRLAQVEPRIQSLMPETGRAQRLLTEASNLERLYPDPASRPPLYGVLMGVKDLFAVDGFETSAGSRLPTRLFRMPEGPVVQALKKAGALVLGKTVSTEFAYFAPGPTRNPFNTEHTPGGSSSGSAAAVAAGLCALSIGTQTIGSIGRPAAFCGVCGWKPSYERTSRKGAVAFSPSLDHVGLFASDAAGLSLAAALIADRWNQAGYLAAKTHLEAPGSAKPVLAIPIGPYLDQAEAEALAHFKTLVGFLAGQGYRIIEVPAFPDISEINERHRRIAAAELERTHRQWFAEFRPLYSPTTVEFIEKGKLISDSQLEKDKLGRTLLQSQLSDLLRKSQADFWLSPSAPGPAPKGIQATGSPIMNLPWTHAGLPTVSLPSGFAANGLPLGVQLVGTVDHDERLLATAEQLLAILGKAC